MNTTDRKRREDWLKTGLAALATTIALGMSSVAMANDVIDDCGQSCEDDCGVDPDCREAVSGKCKLTADITCDETESAISLISGNDLDMKGFDITCTATTCGYAAVTMTDAGTTVTSDGSGDDGEAVISGKFDVGVACGLEANSTVEKITVLDGLTGIQNCKTVKNNVVGPSTQFALGTNLGISTTGIANSVFSDNYVSGRGFGILNSGSATLDVLRNVIHTDVSVAAIWLGGGAGSSANGNAKFNVVFADGYDSSATVITISGTNNVTFDGNFCDEDHPNCASCISGSRCEPFVSPFQGN
jgi:hypothetical protein